MNLSKAASLLVAPILCLAWPSLAATDERGNFCSSSEEQCGMTLKSSYLGHTNGGSGKWFSCEELCRDDPACNSWMGRNSGNTCYLSRETELRTKPTGCCSDHHPYTFNADNCDTGSFFTYTHALKVGLDEDYCLDWRDGLQTKTCDNSFLQEWDLFGGKMHSGDICIKVNFESGALHMEKHIESCTDTFQQTSTGKIFATNDEGEKMYLGFLPDDDESLDGRTVVGQKFGCDISDNLTWFAA